MNGASATSNRRSNRSNVLLKASLEMSGASHEVVLRNLSREGALVQGKALPDSGSRVLFHRQGLSVPGTIAWSHRDYAGIEFDNPLFPNELLRHIPKAAPKMPPIPKRRPGLSTELTPGERALIESWSMRLES